MFSARRANCKTTPRKVEQRARKWRPIHAEVTREISPVADIFQEVEEDVRRERAEKLWKRIAPFVLAAALAIVLGVGGVTAWRHYVASERAAASDRFNLALGQAASGDRAGAIAALGALANEAREPYATLARLRQAALMAETGDKAASATFAEAAAKSSDPLIKEYAELMAVVQTIGADSPDAVISKLEPMTASGRTWRNLARDYLAFVAYKKGDIPLARRVWEDIVKDEKAAPSQKARATELLTVTAAASGDKKGTQ